MDDADHALMRDKWRAAEVPLPETSPMNNVRKGWPTMRS